jgi:tRNA threonylcarbamoyl adenosine modification protein YjeE
VTGQKADSMVLADEDATIELGRQLAATLRAGDLVLLEGPLGAGKTTLARGVVQGLGGDAAEVCSPTFVLLETYVVPAAPIVRVHHADLYRLRGLAAAPLDEVGLGDALADAGAVTLIEWPEGWPWLGDLARRVIRISLDFAGEARSALVQAAATS